MKTIAKQLEKILFARQNSVFSSTLIISMMVIVGGLLGFVRYRILSGYFTKEELDIFFAAFRVPDLIFNILITGALTTSLIPFFIKFQNDKEAQSNNISSVMNIIMLILLGLIFVMTLGMPYIIHLLASKNFTETKLQEITFYTQVLLIGELPFFVFGTFLTAISQAKKAFLLPSLAPLIYDIVIIVTTLLFSQSLYILGPILGVVFGAVMFCIIQIPVLFVSQTFQYRLIIKKTRAIKDFFMMALPRIVTSGLAEIDATIDFILSSSLSAGSYTVFYLSQHLHFLPVSVLGISFGQASLPYLSELYHDKKTEEFKEVIVNSILNIFFLTIPIMGFFIITRTPMVRFFFGGQKFDWTATSETAVALSYFALAIPFHSVYYFLTRSFYAFFDTKTPFIISVSSIIFNALVSITFVNILHLPVWSLALSFALSMMANFVLLTFFLHIKLAGLNLKLLIWESLKMGIAMTIASIICFYIKKIFDNLILDTTRTINIVILLAILGVAYFSIYIFFSWVLTIRELSLIAKMILKIKQYQKRLMGIYTNTIYTEIAK
jgi:putative peptidoglycan lipid II flippase